MECGEECVMVGGIAMLPQLCANSWGTVSTQMKVKFSSFIGDITEVTNFTYN